MSLIKLMYNIIQTKGKDIYESNKEFLLGKEIINNFTLFNLQSTFDKFNKVFKILDNIDDKIDDNDSN